MAVGSTFTYFINIQVQGGAQAAVQFNQVQQAAAGAGNQMVATGGQVNSATTDIKNQANQVRILSRSFVWMVASISAVYVSYQSLQMAQLSSEDAQQRYNEAVEKYGANSKQAELAHRAYERSIMNVRQAQFAFGISILSSAAALVRLVTEAIRGTLANTTLAGSFGVLRLAIQSLAAAFTILVALYVMAKTNSMALRGALSVLVGALVLYTLWQWKANLAATYMIGLSGGGIALIAASAAATAFIATTVANKTLFREDRLNGAVESLGTKIGEHEPGDINVSISLNNVNVDWNQLPVLADQLAQKVQESLETRCNLYGRK